MKTTLALLASWWFGGCCALFSYYAVFLAANANTGIHVHWFIVQLYLFWPFWRAVDLIAWCV